MVENWLQSLLKRGLAFTCSAGFTATDLNGNSGYRSVEQAASIVVKLATINNDGPTGGFFDEDGVVPW